MLCPICLICFEVIGQMTKMSHVCLDNMQSMPALRMGMAIFRHSLGFHELDQRLPCEHCKSPGEEPISGPKTPYRHSA